MAVNGAHLLEYKHKIPLNRVDTFSVSGDVRVHAIGFIPNSVSVSRPPSPSPKIPPKIPPKPSVFVFRTALILDG